MVIQSCYLYPCTRRQLDELTYEKLADETLDELASFFEDLGDSGLCHKDYDTQFSVSNLTPRPFLGPGTSLYSVWMVLLFWCSLWFSAIDTIAWQPSYEEDCSSYYSPFFSSLYVYIRKLIPVSSWLSFYRLVCSPCLQNGVLTINLGGTCILYILEQY